MNDDARVLELLADLDDPTPPRRAPLRLEAPLARLLSGDDPLLESWLDDARVLSPRFEGPTRGETWDALWAVAIERDLFLDLRFDAADQLPRSLPADPDGRWLRSRVVLEGAADAELERALGFHAGRSALLQLRALIGDEDPDAVVARITARSAELSHPLIVTLVPGHPDGLSRAREAASRAPDPVWWRVPGDPSPIPAADDGGWRLQAWLRGVFRLRPELCPFPEVMRRVDDEDTARPCPASKGPRFSRDHVEDELLALRHRLRANDPPAECRGCSLRARVASAIRG